jgi:hypothetical protein
MLTSWQRRIFDHYFARRLPKGLANTVVQLLITYTSLAVGVSTKPAHLITQQQQGEPNSTANLNQQYPASSAQPPGNHPRVIDPATIAHSTGPLCSLEEEKQHCAVQSRRVSAQAQASTPSLTLQLLQQDKFTITDPASTGGVVPGLIGCRIGYSLHDAVRMQGTRRLIHLTSRRVPGLNSFWPYRVFRVRA